MKYTIIGEIDVQDDITHTEMIHKLYAILGAYGIGLKCETKPVKEELTKQ